MLWRFKLIFTGAGCSDVGFSRRCSYRDGFRILLLAANIKMLISLHRAVVMDDGYESETYNTLCTTCSYRSTGYSKIYDRNMNITKYIYNNIMYILARLQFSRAPPRGGKGAIAPIGNFLKLLLI